MRKSLLITSALGLVATALPTLAMAGAAGSSAVCGSGFFAQFDAKVMNAKLEIKNENGSKSTVPADEKTDMDEIVAAAAADLIDLLKNGPFEVLFDCGTGENTEVFLRRLFGDRGLRIEDIRGKSPADVAKAISRIFRLGVQTDAEKRILLTGEGEEFIADDMSDADAAKVFDRIVADLMTLARQATPVYTRGLLNEIFAQTYNVVARDARDDVGNVTRRLLNDMDKGFYNSKMDRKIYVLNLGRAGEVDQKYKDDLRKEINKELDAKNEKGDLIILNQIKESFGVLLFAETAMHKNAALNESYAQTRALEVLDRRVHNHALAGGIGATVGWWQNLGGFALSISGSGDYLWGNFKVVEDKSGSTTNAADKRKLGFGFQGDVGAHYVVSPSTTLGILVGIRGQQLNFGKKPATLGVTPATNSKGDYASKWMINPVVTLQARTFFTDTVYGALSVGYVIPMSEKDFKVENTNVDKDAKVRFQGLTGAFSVGMTF